MLTRRLLATVCVTLAAACGDVAPTDETPGLVARDSVLVLGDRDVRIVTEDGEYEMALVGERVVMRFSDQALAKLGSQLRPGEASGVGGWIEGQVKGTVRSLLHKQMVLPVAAIDEARYENGEIRLLMRDGMRNFSFMGEVNQDGRPSLMSRFAREDAERFVAAVRAAKGSRS